MIYNTNKPTVTLNMELDWLSLPTTELKAGKDGGNPCNPLPHIDKGAQVMNNDAS